MEDMHEERRVFKGIAYEYANFCMLFTHEDLDMADCCRACGLVAECDTWVHHPQEGWCWLVAFPTEPCSSDPGHAQCTCSRCV